LNHEEHEEHEEHEVVQCAIDAWAVTVRANPMATTGFNGTLIIFVCLRVFRGELFFPGSRLGSKT
jgi:hypothetical protein